MIRYYLISVILITCSSAVAQQFPIPDLPEGEVLTYQVSYTGKFADPETRMVMESREFWEQEQVVQEQTSWVGEGKNRHLVNHRTGSLFGGGTDKWTIEFTPGSNLMLDRVEHKVNFPTGKLFHREAHRFRDASLEYPEPIFHTSALNFVFRGLTFAPEQTYIFWHWKTWPTVITEKEVKVVGKEILELPIGRRECWKVEVVTCPETFKGMGIFGFIARRLSHKSTYWMLVDEPHIMARSEIPKTTSTAKTTIRVQELCQIRSDEDPQGIGQVPEIKPPVPFPVFPSTQPFDIPTLCKDDSYRMNVYVDQPVDSFTSLHTLRQFTFLEAANDVHRSTRFVKEEGTTCLEYNYTYVQRNKNTCSTRVRYLPGKAMQMKDITITGTTPSGVIVRDEYICLDDPTFQFPPDLLHRYAAGVAYQNMDLIPGDSREFNMLVGAPGFMLKMRVDVNDIEILSLNDKDDVRCYRLEMVPILSEILGLFGKVLQPFVPKFTWWVTEEKPHTWVRYRGPVGSNVSLGKSLTETFDIECKTDKKQLSMKN
ncbi:MAG: hypothetical protein GY864_12420 [Desulfobacterales bacterium]|nr:hypothetical protein [Desulfobacterales bacterium]